MCFDCDIKCKSCKAKKVTGSTCTKCYDSTMKITNGKCSCPTGLVESSDGVTCCPENCTSCKTDSKKTKGVCSQCSTGFTLAAGICECFGTQSGTSCKPCASGTYFDGSSCVACNTLTPGCAKCNLGTGVCSKCQATFTYIPSSKTCVCPPGKSEVDGVCTDATITTVCPDGEFNDGSGTCVACGNNCSNCKDYTGECKTCGSGELPDLATTPQDCVANC